MWPKTGWVLLWLAAGSSAAWADAESECRRGRDAAASIRACTEIIEDGAYGIEQKAAAFRSRGNARAAAGAHEDAIRDFDEAIRLRPGDAAAFAARGQVRLSRGDQQGAIADLDEALRLDASKADFLIVRGHAHLVASRPDVAIADFNAAIAIQPKNASALNNRGLAYRKKGDLDHAIADYSAAIALNPLYALAFNNRGYAYEAKGAEKLAIADYRNALMIDPALAGAKDGLNRLGSAGGIAMESEEFAAAGKALAEKNCGWCHAVGRAGASPNPKAPEFRNIQRRHPLLALREPLSRGIAAPHDQMPRFPLTELEVDHIVAYINSLGRAE